MAIEFNEKETGFVTLDFTNEDGDAVAPDSATYTLYNERDKTIINGRNQINIVGVTASFDLELEPNDNVIVDTSRDEEQHVLLVEWVYNTDKRGKQQVRIRVVNLTKVT